MERPPANRAAVAAVLAAHPGVVGCLVECADDSAVPPPRLFGSVPAVYLHALRRPGAGALCVSTDNASVALAAYRELSAGRPAAFAVVDDGRPRLWAKARVAAFRGICRKEGRRCHLFSQRDESDAERRARRVEFLRSLPRRTAVFAVNDAMAGYVADDARSAMRSIPFDLTLLGVDNRLDICEASSPQISSIQLDFERAGFAAARMIGDFHEAEGSNGPKHGFKSGNAESIMPLLAVRRQSTGGHGRREKFVLEAVEMIRREATDGLAARELASRFPVSRNLFDLRFREAIGHSVLDEILHVRLEKACTLLSQTDTAVSAIPGLCGFGCDRTCDALFRSRFGTGMREWRMRNRTSHETPSRTWRTRGAALPVSVAVSAEKFFVKN
ncbi:MAG: substrate-binding domain-containing protein [Kiritimatiellae bacterium]|nr:substrate-binding domain-containing protein [Kiritimatiellia bacterium]